MPSNISKNNEPLETVINGFATINPATGKEIKEYHFMSDDEAMEAVEKCHPAFEKWRLKPIDERAKIIKAIDRMIEIVRQMVG